MKTEVIGTNAYQSLRVEMAPGDCFLSEAGKMVRASREIDIDVTMRRKEGGGVMAGLKRMLSGDSFFFARYTANQQGGEVVISPTLVGNVKVLELNGDTWFCPGGSFLACSNGVSADPVWQGLKGLFSGENVVFVKAQGQGFLAVEAFGVITSMEVNGEFIVDTGHVVAFQDSLAYEVTRPAGGSWMTTFLSGEGLVLRFKGHGTVYIQSHNGKAFGEEIGPNLPKRRA